jgi:hypothetical protein
MRGYATLPNVTIDPRHTRTNGHAKADAAHTPAAGPQSTVPMTMTAARFTTEAAQSGIWTGIIAQLIL